MGPFISLSGVVGSSCEDVERAVASFAAERGGRFDAVSDLMEIDWLERACLAAAGDKVSFLHPDWFEHGDAISKHLSAVLGRAVFSFHIYNGEWWTFTLFSHGAEVTEFDPWQKYLDELSEDQRKKVGGDAAAVCAHVPGLSPDSIERYFVIWSKDVRTGGGKAYPDDEHPYGDYSQMFDFMKRVGFVYPDVFDPSDGTKYRLRLPHPALPKKP
ncbi:MAG TPA: hypothetical protein VJ302_23130 [Blastocatellia bacterium]|nr:hypothetical protein [Blastocatellia bacterium]